MWMLPGPYFWTVCAHRSNREIPSPYFQVPSVPGTGPLWGLGVEQGHITSQRTRDMTELRFSQGAPAAEWTAQKENGSQRMPVEKTFQEGGDDRRGH